MFTQTPLKKVINVLSIVSILAVSSLAFAGDDAESPDLIFNKPLFEKFTVPVEARKAPAPNFKTLPKARYFRDRIKSSFSESNFAGHYSLAPWGCGTSCVGMAISIWVPI